MTTITSSIPHSRSSRHRSASITSNITFLPNVNLSEKNHTMVGQLLAGSVGGFCGKLFDYPLDTVKVLLQTQPSVSTTVSTTTMTSTTSLMEVKPQQQQYRGAWDCFRQTIQTQGIGSLYAGLVPRLIGSVAENAVLFWAYGECQSLLTTYAPSSKTNDEPLSIWQLTLAGGGAGLASACVLTPVELIKCRLQVQAATASAPTAATAAAAAAAATSSTTATATGAVAVATASTASPTPIHYRGPMDVLVQTIRQEGFFTGLFRGHTMTILREIPGNACYFGIYELVCRTMIPIEGVSCKSELSLATNMLGGIIAGIGYCTAFYPADTIKSLQQTQSEYSTLNMKECFHKIYQQSGMKGLYRGWGITAIRAAPANAIIFAGYETTLKAWNN